MKNIPVEAGNCGDAKEEDLVEHGHESVVGKAGDGEGLLHIEAVGVELVLAAGHEGCFGELLLIDDLSDVVECVADGLAHIGSESVFLVDHSHDEQGTLAGDLEQVLALGGEDDLLSGGHCWKGCFCEVGW